jgi:hypothetical protein
MTTRDGGDSNPGLDIEMGMKHSGRAVEQRTGPRFNF